MVIQNQLIVIIQYKQASSMNLKFDFNQITQFEDFINNVLISSEDTEKVVTGQKLNYCSIEQIKQNQNEREIQSCFLEEVNNDQKKVQNNYTQSQILSSKSQQLPLQSVNQFNDILLKRGLKRLKQQIKTFPNFIYRVFDHHLSRYEKQIPHESLIKLKEYLEQERGKKHYTLNHLCTLLKDDVRWPCRINRIILNKILNSFSYLQIFKNSQRKKKKTYLIMTKVYKLRCRNSFLSSRVQCQ